MRPPYGVRWPPDVVCPRHMPGKAENVRREAVGGIMILKPIKSNRKAAEKTAWKWFSLFIRIGRADSNGFVKCYTCSTTKHFKEIDAGHYFAQGWAKGIKFDPRNVRPQCVSCNHFKSGNLIVYGERLRAELGNDIETILKIANKTTGKYSEFDFRVIAKHYRKSAQRIAQEKGISLSCQKSN